jgi:hypothetical protein
MKKVEKLRLKMNLYFDLNRAGLERANTLVVTERLKFEV